MFPQMKPPLSSSFISSSILQRPRLSHCLFTLVAFILFLAILYSEDLSCIFRARFDSDPPASTTETNREELPFALGKAEEGCDVFNGRWVRDELTRPLYEESECPYIQPQLTCQALGRPDKDYQHWRWQPHGCSLPRFPSFSPFNFSAHPNLKVG